MAAGQRREGEKFKTYRYRLKLEQKALDIKLRGRTVYGNWSGGNKPATVKFRQTADPTLSPTDRYYV